MSRSGVSILVFGIYLLVLGVLLIAIPNPLLGLVGLPATREVWIRVAGFLVAAIGYYDVRAARADLREFFRWTVHARCAVPPLFAAFVLTGLVGPGLLAFAAVDLSAAVWTALALRADARVVA
jgi:hypothetical protein